MVLNNNLVSLLDQISRVADKLTADQAIHEKIVASQADLSKLMERLDALGVQLGAQDVQSQQAQKEAQKALASAIESQTRVLSKALAGLVEKADNQAHPSDASSLPTQSPVQPVAGAFLADPEPERPKDQS